MFLCTTMLAQTFLKKQTQGLWYVVFQPLILCAASILKFPNSFCMFGQNGNERGMGLIRAVWTEAILTAMGRFTNIGNLRAYLITF